MRALFNGKNLMYPQDLIEEVRAFGDEEALKLVAAMEEVNERGLTYDTHPEEMEEVARRHLGDKMVDELMAW